MVKRRESWKLIMAQSAFLWSGIPILWSFLSTYLNENGFSAGRIGLLMAINPLIAVLIQPFVGVHVDRTKSKNMIFIYLMTGALVCVMLIPLSQQYLYVFVVIVAMSLFQATLIPISESISLESADKAGKSYAPVRMAGTIAYSFTAILIGYLMKQEIRSIFYVTSVIGAMNILAIWKMPNVHGHQTHGNRVPITEVFRDKMLISFSLFAIIAQIMMSFYYTFMPIMYIQLGGTRGGLGWIFFIAAMSEVPFLLWADKIIEKVGNKAMLIISMFAVSLRIFLLIFVKTPGWMFPIALLNGLAFIVFTYTLATYINRTVRKELKTTGQAVLAVAMAIGRILGTMIGGFLIDQVGMNQTIFLYVALSAGAILLFVWATKTVPGQVSRVKSDK